MIDIAQYDTLTVPQATAIQKELRNELKLQKRNFDIKTIGGGDISLNLFGKTVYAGIVILSFPELKLLSYSLVKAEVHFPYVPGYLAFREVPSLYKAWQLLPQKPDVLVVDGHGIAHPRRMGIAAHFGTLTKQPSIGCAKKLLFGKFSEPEPETGSYSPIYDKQEVIGWAMRSKAKALPVYVSPGNLVSMEDSLEIIQQCKGKYRIPEPTRLAHETVNRFRTGELQAGYWEV